MRKRRAGRPQHCRCVQDLPKVTCFTPSGVAPEAVEQVLMTVDELEAMRLADRDGLYHADAAMQMKVSRPTFGRILESGRRKVADALVGGKQICIEGGTIIAVCDSIPTERPDICLCPTCGREFPHVKGVPCRYSVCPDCNEPLQRKGGCLSDEEEQQSAIYPENEEEIEIE